MRQSSEHSSGNRKDTVKADIPRQLRQAIIRIQAGDDLSWEDAAVKAALLTDANGKLFKPAGEREAPKLAESRFMSQLSVNQTTELRRGFYSSA